MAKPLSLQDILRRRQPDPNRPKTWEEVEQRTAADIKRLEAAEQKRKQ